MPKKRKSRGRHKGGKGKEDLVQCDECGALLPRSKAVKITKPVVAVDPQLVKELRDKGAIIPQYTVTKYLCLRCAIHRGIIKIRPEDERKKENIKWNFF